MKKLVALLLAVLLIACISVPAFATDNTDSNQGGPPEKPPVSPPTGSLAIIALAVVACGAGAAYVVSKNKSK